jgi:hypothetical protein
MENMTCSHEPGTFADSSLGYFARHNDNTCAPWRMRRTALAIAAFVKHVARCRTCCTPKLCAIAQGLLIDVVKVKPLKAKP